MSVIEKDMTTKAKNPYGLKDEMRQRCEVWTRVMGYHRPTSSYNKGKKGEFAERKYFREQVRHEKK